LISEIKKFLMKLFISESKIIKYFFDDISTNYDFVNPRTPFEKHQGWKLKMTKILALNNLEIILYLATSTLIWLHVFCFYSL
jgi:ubiquinone/menaquinone biosynthesis C-methylase UbiE